MSAFQGLLQVIFNTIAPIFLVLGVTIFVSRYKRLDVETLSRISIYVFSPALVLVNIAETKLGTAELTSLVAAAIVVCLVMAGVGSILARLLRLDRKIASAFVLTAFVMNSVNFGYPFIEFAFGPEGLEPAVAFTVGQALMAYLLGTYVASRGEAGFKTAVRNALTIPMPYAFVVALAFNLTDSTIPPVIMQTAQVLAKGIIPATLVVLGLQLRGARLRGQWRPIAWATFTRYGLGALVAVGVATLFGLQGLSRQVFILEASMPAGILTGVLSTEFGGDAEFAASVILVTTLASTIFLSGLLLWLTG